ncbi:MAG: serine hydrolase [Candidatus Saccharibacteria bacterium]|nr:serine hydrolase [Candidatus Saccharibacteria bacterium]
MRPQEEKVFDIKKIVLIVLGVVFLVVAVAAGIVFIPKLFEKPDEPVATTTATAEPEEEKPKTPEKINLQLTVDKWLDTLSDRKNAEVMVYDLDNEAIIARFQEDASIRIESIYKMFVVYEGYYRIDHGIWNKDDSVGIGKNYDGKPFTYAICLDYAVRYSYSPCAEALWSKIGHDQLQKIYNEKGFTGTNIQGITSTPSDLVKLYQMFWKHSDLSEDSWGAIKDSMINQDAPKNAYSAMQQNWRKGLPSGFATAKVYDKVGWWGDGNGHWNYYADAAFLNFPETTNNDGETVPERNYIAIVLTRSTDPSELVKLGRNIESAIKTADNY